MAEFAHTGIVGKVLGRDRNALFLAFKDLAQTFARQPGDFPLKRTNTSLTRIIPHQIAQTFLGKCELTLLQPMRFDLLFDQVALSNFDLLVLGVAFEPDDLHPVEQRLRQVEAVGGADKHNV